MHMYGITMSSFAASASTLACIISLKHNPCNGCYCSNYCEFHFFVHGSKLLSDTKYKQKERINQASWLKNENIPAECS